MMYPVSKVLANQLYEINQIKDNRLYPNKIVGLFQRHAQSQNTNHTRIHSTCFDNYNTHWTTPGCKTPVGITHVPP